QGRTDNSWGPRAIVDHGAPVSLPKLKKAYEKGSRGISWGPLLTPGPRAVAEFPNGHSAPDQDGSSSLGDAAPGGSFTESGIAVWASEYSYCITFFYSNLFFF
ncbi:unnamed protein product, partial [Staurois parvus]